MKSMHELDKADCSSHSHCFAELLSNCGLLSWPQQSEAENSSIPSLWSLENISFEGSKDSKHCRFLQTNTSQSFEPYTKAVIALFLEPATEFNLEPVLAPTLWSFKETREGPFVFVFLFTLSDKECKITQL